MVETYTFTVEGDLAVTEINGKKFGFRKWTWGEQNALKAECQSINQMSGEVILDVKKFDEELVIRTVRYELDGKFIPFTAEEVRALDGQLGERLYQITTKLNLVSQIEAKNLV